MSSAYPERDIVDSSCIFQQRIRETQLFECLDGFGLHSIGLACRCFVVAIIEDNYCNSKADEIATLMLLISSYCSGFGILTYASINPDGPAPTTTTVVDASTGPMR